MSGVIEQGDICADQLVAETLDRIVEACFVQLDLGAAADQREAEPMQGIGHQQRVIPGIFQPRHVLVGGIAYDEGHAFFSSGREGETRCKQQSGKALPMHCLFP